MTAPRLHTVYAACFASVAMLCASAHAAETGTLSRAENLRAKPFADAPITSPAAMGSKVDILSRNGGWYQVKTAGKTGWVRMLSVRRNASSGNSLAGLAAIDAGRAGTGKVATTTGIRGLDAQELASATFNAAQITKAESYRTSPARAASFARQGKLQVRDVPALPAPAPK